METKNTNRTRRVHGHEAIEMASRDASVVLCNYTDPTEEAREGLTVSEAEEIAREDAELIYADVACSITESDIRELESEANEAGDREQARICRDALTKGEGSEAWQECVDVILDARAQDDEDANR